MLLIKQPKIYAPAKERPINDAPVTICVSENLVREVKKAKTFPLDDTQYTRTDTIGGWNTDMAAAKKCTVMLLLSCEFIPNDRRMKVGSWRDDKQEWEVFGASWTPTHWRHLPKPPE